MTRILGLLAFALFSMHADASGGTAEERACGFITPPDILKVEGWLEGSLARVEAERANAAQYPEESGARKAYLSAVKDLEWSRLIHTAKKHLIENDPNGYRFAIEALQTRWREDPSNFPAHELLILYVHAADYPSMPSFDWEVLSEALKYALENRESEHAYFNTYTDIANAIYSIESGVHVNVDQLRSNDAKGVYLHAFLTYKQALASSSIDELRSAIEVLRTTGDNPVLDSCDRSVKGKLHVYLADSLYQLAWAMSRKSQLFGPQEIEGMFSQARLVIDNSSRYFDPIYFPGLWARSYELKADVYDSLITYETVGSKRDRYKLIYDRALALATK